MKTLLKTSLKLFTIVGLLCCLAISTHAQQDDQKAKLSEKYVGEYKTTKAILKVYVEEGQLKLEGPNYPPLDMISSGDHKFFVEAFNMDMEFKKEKDGKFEAVTFSTMDGNSYTATRVESKKSDN
ncbi:hypothetical protein [Roseivirga sp.]|uniref:hypothetical protein n=1 Tax=Roseivirga sp. TaxID=1964215 RepID=UPI003B5160EB